MKTSHHGFNLNPASLHVALPTGSTTESTQQVPCSKSSSRVRQLATTAFTISTAPGATRAWNFESYVMSHPIPKKSKWNLFLLFFCHTGDHAFFSATCMMCVRFLSLKNRSCGSFKIVNVGKVYFFCLHFRLSPHFESGYQLSGLNKVYRVASKLWIRYYCWQYTPYLDTSDVERKMWDVSNRYNFLSAKKVEFLLVQNQLHGVCSIVSNATAQLYMIRRAHQIQIRKRTYLLGLSGITAFLEPFCLLCNP